MEQPYLVHVAAFVPVPGTFTYRVPSPWNEAIQRGMRVVVPFGAKRVVGVVLQTDVSGDGIEPQRIKAVEQLLDQVPLLDDELLELLLWMASYYLASVGEAIRAGLPAALQAREQQVVWLTDEGRRVLAAQEEVLRLQTDQLAPRQLVLLQRIEQKGGKCALRQLLELPGGAKLLSGLSQRGLIVQQRNRKASPPAGRQDLRVCLVPGVDPAVLVHAPRQLALVQALLAVGGQALLGALKPRPADARAVAARLAAKGVVTLQPVEIPRDPFAAEPAQDDHPPLLNEEQQAALAPLQTACERRRFGAFLLHGVTGSGKTEVYLRLIETVLPQNRTALVLVPEISLTPQLAARFRARFPGQVAVLHSGLTDAERYSQWELIRSSQVRIVVGARSAIFAPLKALGVIIVDEEHDPSFKQERGVTYHARDLALLRAKRSEAVAVLGSATPSMESYHGVSQGRLQLLTMMHRATPRPLPQVEIIDLRQYRTGSEGFLSAPLAQALGVALERGQQAILFLNRRGFSTFVLCRACGYVFRCSHCSVTLTYHRSASRLTCHYCGHSQPVPRRCPDCHAESIEMLGLGTEQVEQALVARFPSARVARLDRDTATGRGLQAILKRVNQREIDILVGTQMVTKGHDFPYVTVVGVICADLGLHFPDFRAAERTFQLLTQVAGRAGRGTEPGRVIIQTYSPDHPSLVCARNHDYPAFYRHEMAVRKELSYPPWSYLTAIRIDGPDETAVQETARRLAGIGQRLITRKAGITILGPAEAPIQKLKDRTRWLLLLKGGSRQRLRQLIEGLLAQAGATQAKGVRITVDVDPVMML